jgi:hypothetical protein
MARRSQVTALVWLNMFAALLVAAAGLAAADRRMGTCDDVELREPYGLPTFLGYACQDATCAAHKAGFAWADRQGISDPLACADVDDPAFAEGCRAFAEQAVTAEQSGFEWARENDLADDCRCTGAGPRFAAGCEAYVTGFGS